MNDSVTCSKKVLAALTRADSLTWLPHDHCRGAVYHVVPSVGIVNDFSGDHSKVWVSHTFFFLGSCGYPCFYQALGLILFFFVLCGPFGSITYILIFQYMYPSRAKAVLWPVTTGIDRVGVGAFCTESWRYRIFTYTEIRTVSSVKTTTCKRSVDMAFSPRRRAVGMFVLPLWHKIPHPLDHFNFRTPLLRNDFVFLFCLKK